MNAECRCGNDLGGFPEKGKYFVECARCGKHYNLIAGGIKRCIIRPTDADIYRVAGDGPPNDIEENPRPVMPADDDADVTVHLRKQIEKLEKDKEKLIDQRNEARATARRLADAADWDIASYSDVSRAKRYPSIPTRDVGA